MCEVVVEAQRRKMDRLCLNAHHISLISSDSFPHADHALIMIDQRGRQRVRHKVSAAALPGARLFRPSNKDSHNCEVPMQRSSFH